MIVETPERADQPASISLIPYSEENSPPPIPEGATLLVEKTPCYFTEKRAMQWYLAFCELGTEQT